MQSANKVVRDLEDTTVKKKMGDLSLFNLEKRNPKKNLIADHLKDFKRDGTKFSLVIVTGGKTFSNSHGVVEGG